MRNSRITPMPWHTSMAAARARSSVAEFSLSAFSFAFAALPSMTCRAENC